jgi:hypothetical protein
LPQLVCWLVRQQMKTNEQQQILMLVREIQAQQAKIALKT